MQTLRVNKATYLRNFNLNTSNFVNRTNAQRHIVRMVLTFFFQTFTASNESLSDVENATTHACAPVTQQQEKNYIAAWDSKGLFTRNEIYPVTNICIDYIIFTVRNEVAKVMFLHLSVILFTPGVGGVCLSACWDTTPLGSTPPQEAHPLEAHTTTRPPPPDGCRCGRYASYWNAFLWEMNFGANGFVTNLAL